MATRILAVVDRLQDTDGFAPGARLRFYETGTTTPISVFEDAALDVEFSQPVICDEYGSAPPIYYSGTAPYRVLATDADGATLPGFPRDDMVGIPADLTGASAIPFTPTEDLPFTTVQDAIEGAAALVTDQTDTQDRALTPWTTAGTGDAYTITPDPALTGYGTFNALRVKVDRANTGAATLNVNALGERNLRKTARTLTPTALAAGDLQPGDILDVTYDGTQFVIVPNVSTGTTAYRRYPSGDQWCEISATLVYFSTIAVSYTWSFPVAFSAAPHISLTLPFASENYTDISSRTLVPFQAGSVGTTAATVYCLTATGTAAIPSTATIANVRLRAEGRWF